MQPLGIHGTFVAVDWDDCIADGGCLPVCPVAVFEWLQNPGKSGKDERAGYADKSDPIREADCIFCMACVTVCPTTAIKIDQSLVTVAKQQPAPAKEPSLAQAPTPEPAPAQQPTPAQQPSQHPAPPPAQQLVQQPAQQPPPAQQPAPAQLAQKPAPATAQETGKTVPQKNLPSN